MKHPFVLKGILLVAGLVAIAIGTAILFFPIAFYGSYGIDVSGKISLINELKAPGLALAASGLLIASARFLPPWRQCLRRSRPFSI